MPNVAYHTDIEGNWEYFQRLIGISPALVHEGTAEDGSAILALADGWHYIHGGDCVDKGGKVGGSVRTVRTLNRLKRRYPDRVTLLLGNRDLNKMSMASELTPSQLTREISAIPGAPWVPVEKQVGPEKYLRKLLSDKLGVPPADVPASALAAANTLPARIRWMLKEPMGADGEFERRAAELEAISGVSPSEAQVAASFVNSVADGGFMRELLLNGQLGVVIGDTLYVHGGIIGKFAGDETDALGYVPGREGRVMEVRAWVDELNEWMREQVDQWCARPHWPTLTSTDGRGGHDLMAYVAPGCVPSVVMGRHLDAKGMPLPVEDKMAARLNAGGVRRLVLGHTPHGNCPTVIKTGGPSTIEPCLLVILADTSYSDMKARAPEAFTSVAYSPPPTRGYLPASHSRRMILMFAGGGQPRCGGV